MTLAIVLVLQNASDTGQHGGTGISDHANLYTDPVLSNLLTSQQDTATSFLPRIAKSYSMAFVLCMYLFMF